MVSSLWHAASDGDLAKVQEIAQTASTVDLEIKDHTGATPLIQAVKNGHVDVVHALLTAGADPNNGSSQGPPENHTSNPAILDALAAARAKNGPTSNGAQQPQAQQPQQPPPMPYEAYPPYDPSKAGYYPHMRYVPYPYMNGHVDGSAPPPPPPGAMHYYPPPPMPDQQQMQQQPQQPSPEDGSVPAMPSPGPGSNLPPADVARSIPCRYFPSCRYGAACMFLHPTGPGPYYPAAVPAPGQYPPGYDPMNPAAAQYPTYYPVPPPAFPHGAPPPPTHMVGMSPSSAHPPVGHQRSPSEQMLSPVPAQFSPNAPPPPPPGTYAVPVPAPMSPPYAPNGHLVGPPPMHHPHPQSPQAMYPVPPAQPGHPPHHHRSESYGSYPPPMSPVDQSQLPRSPTGHTDVADNYGPPREGMYPRRGGNRRGSFSNGGGGRKPPCLFYPSGRCKNGDDCRFPHVMDGGNRPNGHSGYPSRYPPRNNRPVPFSAIEEKMASLSINGDAPNGHARTNGANHSPDSTEAVNPTGRYPPNGKHYFTPSPKRVNGAGNSLTPPASKPQRVPSADEFPVLKGSTSPTANGHIVNGTLNGGPTAAQILQGAKKGAVSPRHTSPPTKAVKTLDADPQADHLPVPSHTVEA